MTARSKRLQVVLELARSRERQAAQALAERIRQAGEQRHQQQQLQAYQEEYRSGFSRQSASPQTAEQLRNFQAFYRNLDRAIDSQSERLSLAEQHQQQARLRWQSAYARQQNLGELVQRLASEEEQALEKKPQREIDDRYNVMQSTFAADNPADR